MEDSKRKNIIPYEELILAVFRGDRKSAAKLMKFIDDREDGYLDVLAKIYPATGKSLIIGITGSPGCGKSTIIDGLISAIRKKGKKVGVVAIDPSSHLSGGAILGDRVRMQSHSTDSGVFIRSVATRGGIGGLSPSAIDICRIMEAMGMDVILIETVGVGQDEVDIRIISSVTVLVLSPDTGDSIQLMKAGIMEIADIFVVNKKDKEESMNIYQELKNFLNSMENIQKPVILTQAINGDGIEELLKETEAFQEPHDRKKLKLRMEILRRLSDIFITLVNENLSSEIDIEVGKIQSGIQTPYEVLKKFKAIAEKTFKQESK